MFVGTRVRLIKQLAWFSPELGATGTYTFGADYVPGWDAGRFEVTMDEPDANGRTNCSHWTLEELLTYWEPIPGEPRVEVSSNA